MITIKFLGGAKKSFQTDQIHIKQSNISINDLLEELIKQKPADTHEFDTENMLIAVNGVDSSAIQGKDTIIHDEDIVSIIPVIHGGTTTEPPTKIHDREVQIMAINGGDINIGVKFLEDLRRMYPNVVIQAVSKNFVASKSHVEKILDVSLKAEKNNALLSKKIEMDILMRFALTGQISKAIKDAGIKPGTNFILILIGNPDIPKPLYAKFESLSDDSEDNHHNLLKKHFNITKKHLDTVSSNTPLEDILVEKAVIII